MPTVPEDSMPLRIGIDIGGTFTDLVAHDPERRKLYEHKVLTTPSDPAAAVLAVWGRIGPARVFCRALLRSPTAQSGLAVRHLYLDQWSRTRVVDKPWGFWRQAGLTYASVVA